MSVICWCGKICDYLSGDCYACPVHGFDFLKPKILDIAQISMGITGKNNLGLNIHKMRWCIYVEITKQAHEYAMKNDDSAKLCRVKRDGEYVDVPVERRIIATKPIIKKWLKQFNLNFDDLVKNE